jgi:hypothetical protein
MFSFACWKILKYFYQQLLSGCSLKAVIILQTQISSVGYLDFIWGGVFRSPSI